jgi:hypothetical protein
MAGPPPPLKTSVREDERAPPDSTPASVSGFSAPNGSVVSNWLSGLATSVLGRYVAAFAIVWFVFGFAGFIMSFVCFGYTGSVGEKLLGLILAIMMGPMYWLYYFVSPSYCKANPPAFF